MAQAGTETTLQFVINPYLGGLSINVPTNGTFTSIESPDTDTVISTMLDTVTVTDKRRDSLNLTWTTNAVSTNFITGVDTLTADTIGYSAGPATLLLGLAGVTEFTQTALNVPIRVQAGATLTGKHIVSWRPTLRMPVPYNKPPGTYTARLTHSVF